MVITADFTVDDPNSTSVCSPSGVSAGISIIKSTVPVASAWTVDTIFDAVSFTSADDLDRLRLYAKGGYTTGPQPGFWTPGDLGR